MHHGNCKERKAKFFFFFKLKKHSDFCTITINKFCLLKFILKKIENKISIFFLLFEKFFLYYKLTFIIFKV